MEALLAPHVDHLTTVPVLVYELLMRAFGLGSYWPWLGVLWLCHFGCAALLYRITSNAANPWLGALAAVSLLTLGPAFEDLLHAFQVGFLSRPSSASSPSTASSPRAAMGAGMARSPSLPLPWPPHPRASA